MLAGETPEVHNCAMQLARFPRRRYTPHFTPLEKLPNLTAALGGPEIWIKRDDLLGLAAGGNKTRKLEFLVADALAQGADTLITVGAPQSNHCRLTLAAAAKEGLKCRLALEQRVAGSYNPNATGNNFLYNLLGAEEISVVNAGDDLNAAMQAHAAELEAAGRAHTLRSAPDALTRLECSMNILLPQLEALATSQTHVATP